MSVRGWIAAAFGSLSSVKPSTGHVMTADIVNLRTARKAKARLEKERTASERRAQFGRTKVEKLKAKAEVDKASVLLDGHRLAPNAPESAAPPVRTAPKKTP